MRLARYEELESISTLMNSLFHKQMQKAYSKEGKIAFLEQITLQSLQERFKAESLFYIDEKIETVLELENKPRRSQSDVSLENKPRRSQSDVSLENTSHIAFLFSKYTRVGNAHKLMKMM